MKQILLLGHTHHDVGYTNSPRIIDRMHARIVDEVLDLIDANPGTGPDPATNPDAMRWTFEVARPVLNFLKTADAASVARLKHAVDTGRVSVTGGYLNMAQLLSEQEFDASYDALAQFAELGIPVRTEQHGDVNGTAWGSVPAMRRAGIQRLVMALNPDHGRPPFTQPTGFWWEGPDGGRVFTWLSTHYGFGEEWGIVDGDVELAEKRILEFVDALEARDDYPYDTALVHAGNDNRWPTALFLEVVRHWNARHPELPMRTTTIDEALDILEPQATDAPVVRGEWSDWWSHGHGSTAREVAVYREARSLALTAQASLALTRLRGDGSPTLATVLGYRRGPVQLRTDREISAALDEVDEQLLLFSEHTWGSWETYSKPHSVFSHSHWNAKAGFAYAAYDFGRDLAIEGLFRVVASGADAGADRAVAESDSVLVFNPTERHRTEPVTVELRAPGNTARLGSAVASVPPFGAAVIPVPQLPRDLGEGTVIETATYRATVDPARGGVVSLIDLRDGRELVDAELGHGLGAVLIDRVAADSTHPMVTTNPKDFHPDNPGPDFERHVATGSAARISETDDFVQLEWTTSGPTIPSAATTLRLYHDSDLIDLDVYLVKPEVFEPESIFVAFPFAVAEPEFLLETAGAVYAADSEQLQDTSKDWYSIQHAVGVAGPDRGAATGILWGSIDAPLVQVGGIHTGKWARQLDARGGEINSWLANNLHFTNFQARQEATGRYRYRFAPRQVTHESVRVFGRDLLLPLQARQYEGTVRLQGSAGPVIEPQDALLAELRPTESGVRLRLRNPADEERTVTVDGTPVTVPAFGVAQVQLS